MAAALVAPMVLMATPVQAQPARVALAAAALSDDPFSALVGRRARVREVREERRPVERYVLASENRAFLFEDRGDTARVVFLCGPDDERLECVIDPYGPVEEIVVLSANRAPRGDITYKDLNGRTVLRLASYGGATVYWPGRQDGEAASKSFGERHALELLPTTFETAQLRAQAATARVSARFGRPVVFDLGKSGGGDDADVSVLGGAVVSVAKGMAVAARDPALAKKIGSKIKRVKFVTASYPALEVKQNTLFVRYSEAGGVQRPISSIGVTRFLRREFE